MSSHSHISFKPTWTIGADTIHALGQCEAFIYTLSETPIFPNYRRKLLNVSLVKGAQSTTAIEGNTLSEEEINQLVEGKELPPSKEYQAQEVKNILEAFNSILARVVNGDSQLLSPEFIKDLHTKVGKNLGTIFRAIPGQFRKENVFVGHYKPPDHQEIDSLMKNFCTWMKEYFHFERGQSFPEVVIQSIVSHVYIAWIHPFGDGNGRTARLLEFYILLRAGNPDFASHILSNFYNETRPEYYAHLDKSTKTGDLSEFIAYAVKGYLDGLKKVVATINKSQVEVFWRGYIHDTFNNETLTAKNETVNKRRRNLVLSMPYDRPVPKQEVTLLTRELALVYRELSDKTVDRDLQELLRLELITEVGSNEFRINQNILKKALPKKARKK
ncbi:cell filamentation protein Fic [Leptospira wolffii]|uniref:Cell filamentation protein Fic n=1 Tax=Leptospira wolffii TaxID=409998 RepID=A0A2M9ZEA0_9LEPT|nr:Fic family protein [Leptospira wolffii]PJZ66682.1 cell filamentation protein Fic [Leptospira wolffii]